MRFFAFPIEIYFRGVEVAELQEAEKENSDSSNTDQTASSELSMPLQLRPSRQWRAYWHEGRAVLRLDVGSRSTAKSTVYFVQQARGG